MSYASVRPFFRTRFEGLGYSEHVDAVDFSNIESNVLDDTFHMETVTSVGSAANQLTHDVDYDITIRLFKRGYADPVEAYDDADSIIDTVLADILDPDVRLGTTIKDIVPGAINKNPLSASDDNDLIIEFNFSVQLICTF